MAPAVSSRSLCQSLADFETLLGHEIALTIKQSRDAGEQLILILPVGPMGMYRWVVYFLTEWGVPCDHVHGFNMDEWSDAEGKSLPASDPGSFERAMEGAFYGPLGKLTVPPKQRAFATRTCCRITPSESANCGARAQAGGDLRDRPRLSHRVLGAALCRRVRERSRVETANAPAGAKLHPLTIEQNAITSFKSRTTLVPAFANTIGPGLFLGADKIIGGCDGAFGRGMMWQGLSVWMTLRHEPTPWIPSTYMPTQPGRLFILQELAGPLVAECN